MAIEFIPAVCPKCGGELRAPNNMDVIKCMYCGADIILHDSTKIKMESTVDAEKYLILTERAINAQNYEEAYKYITVVLEQQPFLPRAVLLKGLIAGFLLKINEAHEYLNMSLIDDESINETRALYNFQVAEHLLDVSNFLFDKFADLSYSLDLVRNSIPNEYYELEDKHYHFRELALSFYVRTFILSATLESGKSKERLAALSEFHTISIIKRLLIREKSALSGIYSSDGASSIKAAISDAELFIARIKDELSGTDLLNSPELIEMLNNFKKMIHETKTKHQEPKQETSKKCFIATATIGDVNHPYICVLREYRDSILLTSRMGKLFINLYYLLSPPLAKIISKHQILKEISLKWIVFPAYKKAIKASTHTDTRAY